MKRTLTLATLLALGAAAYAPLPSMAQTNFSIVVKAPPAPVHERVPAARRGYVWAPGHWEWRGHKHQWMPGVWIAERPGYAYTPASWHRRGNGWYLEPAQWKPARGADRDRDGIPNRVDRDRDGDGVPNRFDRAPNNGRHN